MSTNFQIAFKKHNGNLHVHPSGDFDGSSAFQLIRLLDKKYDGQGEVIIDTHKLQNILPFGSRTFQGQLNLSRIPASRLSFKGEKGHALAPRGCKVVAAASEDRCRCSSKCAHCPCAQKN